MTIDLQWAHLLRWRLTGGWRVLDWTRPDRTGLDCDAAASTVEGAAGDGPIEREQGPQWTVDSRWHQWRLLISGGFFPPHNSTLLTASVSFDSRAPQDDLDWPQMTFTKLGVAPFKVPDRKCYWLLAERPLVKQSSWPNANRTSQCVRTTGDFTGRILDACRFHPIAIKAPYQRAPDYSKYNWICFCCKIFLVNNYFEGKFLFLCPRLLLVRCWYSSQGLISWIGGLFIVTFLCR